MTRRVILLREMPAWVLISLPRTHTRMRTVRRLIGCTLSIQDTVWTEVSYVGVFYVKIWLFLRTYIVVHVLEISQLFAASWNKKTYPKQGTECYTRQRTPHSHKIASFLKPQFVSTCKCAVAQLVEALRYKPERRWFDSRWCHWNFSLT
jgi:hypothetical protein